MIRETVEDKYQTIALYVSTYSGHQADVTKVIADLDDGWKYGGSKPVDGIASSISTTDIDFGEIDQWLVACLNCCYLWHPIKDDPELQNERYRALLRILHPEIPPIGQVDLRRAKELGLFPLIDTAKLSARNLPSDDSVWFDVTNERDPRSVMALGLSSAGYEFMDMKMFELLGVVESLAFGGQERVLECFNTTGLRLLLFALQRRHHNAVTGLKTDSLTRAIVAKLRTRLS